MTDKTDKIRERLKDCNDYRDWQDLMDGYDRVSSALEAVVERLRCQCYCGEPGWGDKCDACYNLESIADELDVEEE